MPAGEWWKVKFQDHRTAAALAGDTMERPDDTVHVKSTRLQCTSCRLAPQCLPGLLTADQAHQFESGVQRCQSLGSGEHLFRAGDPFRSLFAVQSGSCKEYMVDSVGREHVISFHFAGELMAIDAIYTGRHPSSCVALTNSKVCILPYLTLTSLAREIPALQKQILKLCSREILGNSALAGNFSAEERLATFLVMVAARQRNPESTDLDLAMTRQDMANYLRLAPETLSRILARFQKMGLVLADRRHITLLDLDGLAELAACMNPYARYGRRRNPQ
ncbi:MAG: helix-turn-helix domain-containing protein [Gammaproteobacteria bacterium]